jgi:hypothetical protein
VSATKAYYEPVQDIIKKTGWTNEKTFQRFYNKPVENTDKSQSKLLGMAK